MLLKNLVGAILLAAMACPAVGQEFPTAADIMRPAPRSSAYTPRYAIAYGRIMARIDKSGVTKFNYQKGRLVSEVLPDAVIGTYQYDRAGKFQGVVYNDGKTIAVAYNSNGGIAGLTTNSKSSVTFKGASRSALNAVPLRGFLAIQNGISTIRNNYCVGTDDDATCTIYVEDTRPNADDGAGWGGGTLLDPRPRPGEGGIYPSTGTPYETPAECQQYICEAHKKDFDKICALVAKPGADRANCNAKSTEYHAKCLPSCEYADWSWLKDFSFIWG